MLGIQVTFEIGIAIQQLCYRTCLRLCIARRAVLTGVVILLRSYDAVASQACMPDVTLSLLTYYPQVLPAGLRWQLGGLNGGHPGGNSG
eukprot:6174557-Pleurochrysis_carterae.AAC.2